MKIKQGSSKRYSWRRLHKFLEVWECVKTNLVKRTRAEPLAWVTEQVRPSDGKSYFVWWVGKKTGWEYKRREAMDKAERNL